MKGTGDTMKFNENRPASEHDIQHWNDRLDGLPIGEQLRLFWKAVKDVEYMIHLVSDFGYRLQAAAEAGVLSKDEMCEWELASLSYFNLVLDEALAVQVEE